ncbi:hypothetical protein OG21DRAFT_1494977 [Imleria badia]|nr:hypothetical protein OG21DRAFT_1494977 [Imleria badia]
MNNATTYLQPLSEQLANATQSGNPDVATVTVHNIIAVILNTAAQLQNAQPIDLSGLDSTSLYSATHKLLALCKIGIENS